MPVDQRLTVYGIPGAVEAKQMRLRPCGDHASTGVTHVDDAITKYTMQREFNLLDLFTSQGFYRIPPQLLDVHSTCLLQAFSSLFCLPSSAVVSSATTMRQALPAGTISRSSRYNR